MNAIGWFWHLVNFIAPALWLALALAAWDGLIRRKAARALAHPRRWRRGLLLDWGLGSAVLLASLVITGHDGRMATYGALALVVAARRCLIP
ncbi:MAG: hypothetical protein LBH10_01655 [Burkholderiaceae bacterium]|jgi:hypothetical protein|nr:hypothetical protein [Burkholderiaceae bacterium]